MKSTAVIIASVAAIASAQFQFGGQKGNLGGVAGNGAVGGKGGDALAGAGDGGNGGAGGDAGGTGSRSQDQQVNAKGNKLGNPGYYN